MYCANLWTKYFLVTEQINLSHKRYGFPSAENKLFIILKLTVGIEEADCILSGQQMKAMSLLDDTEKSGHNYLLSTESIFASENSPVSLTTSGKFVYKRQLSKNIIKNHSTKILGDLWNNVWYNLRMKSWLSSEVLWLSLACVRVGKHTWLYSPPLMLPNHLPVKLECVF